MGVNKIHITKKLKSILWVFAAALCIVLLVSAVYYKENKKCLGLKIEIVGDNLNYFVNKYNVYAIIKKYGGDTTNYNSLQSINLKKIENELEKMVWVNKAELFFDNNNILNVLVSECAPIARIFTNTGNSFYIDSTNKVLPLNSKYAARVPVFTNFKPLGKVDTSMYNQIKIISTKINNDTFLMAMIEQIDILPNKHFELIPKIGDHTILLGDALDIDSKFEKLKLFYKKVTPVVGWNKYNKLNLQFKNQIVASLKGIDEIASDSLTALMLIQSNAEFASKKSADSLQSFKADIKDDEIKVDSSAEREDEQEGGDIKTLIKKDVKKTIPALVPLKSTVISAKVITTNQTNKLTVKPIVKTTATNSNKKIEPIKKPIKLETKKTTTSTTKTNIKPLTKQILKPLTPQKK